MPLNVTPLLPGLLALHAPDRLFSLSVNLVFAVVVVAVLTVALRRLSRRQDHRLAPTMGVMAAFVFAAQMVNFPVASGTTGHLLGGTLAAILLGPWAGSVVMAAVIVFQALLGDGGLTVLGPNIFNMGIIGTLLAYFVYRAMLGSGASSPTRVVAASSFAAWLAVVLASVFAGLQLAVSGTAAIERALPAMLLTHMAIGLGEALITAGVVAFVLKTRPDLLYDRAPAAARPVGRVPILAGLAASLVVALFLSLLPTLWDYPDGLEYVGYEQGFVAEECAKAEDGTWLTLPAYPLGVRLSVTDGAVTVCHRYSAPTDSQVGSASAQPDALASGDVLLSVNGAPVRDLPDVAAALRFDEAARTFGIRPGEYIPAVVLRGNQTLAVTMRAASSPIAGTASPLIALLPDYTVPGIEGLLSTSLAGGVGTIVMFFVSLAVGRFFTRPGRLEGALREARAQERPSA